MAKQSPVAKKRREHSLRATAERAAAAAAVKAAARAAAAAARAAPFPAAPSPATPARKAHQRKVPQREAPQRTGTAAPPAAGVTAAGADASPLLADVTYLAGNATGDGDPATRGIYARAAVVLGVAAIEAVNNDALGLMRTLIATPAPPGRAEEAPWRHFAGRSAKYLDKMLNRKKYASRMDHVLAQIRRIEKAEIDPALVRDMDRLRSARNRVLHMRQKHLPHRHAMLMDAEEIARLAGLAETTARRYADFVGGAFARFGLPLGGGVPGAGAAAGDGGRG